MPAVAMPRLYAIVDEAYFSAAPDAAQALAGYAAELAAGGATLVQYRDKSCGPRELLARARELRRALPPAVRLIVNDRADLCVAAGCDGVHVGQDDLSPAGARAVVGDRLWVGVSTHSVTQVQEADAGPADYLAIGPVFATRSKQRPDAVVGLEGVRAARAATAKPLVAIGGITRHNCRAVRDAGADAVAVISDLLDTPRKSTEEFLLLLG